MRLMVDNADGLGAVDYTRAMVTVGPLTISRRWNERTMCSALLDTAGARLTPPASRAMVTVESDAGTVLFSGYVVRTEVEGGDVAGSAAGCIRMEAADSIWLSRAGATQTGQTETAGAEALQPVGAATHPVVLAETAVTWQPLGAQGLRGLATDVTLSGEREPTTFATEIFRGDGTTALFALSSPPFRPVGSTIVVQEDFASRTLDARRWSVADPGQYVSVGGAGLTVAGGNGLDGQTVVSLASNVEMGGTIVAEASGVVLQPGSDGVLIGMYSGAVSRANCFAGVRVKGAAGAQKLVALVNGAEAGTPLAFAAGHGYTVRVRLFCAEWQRELGTFNVLVNGALQSYGGGLVHAPLQVVIEVVDEGLASNTLATVLFDGAVAVGPAVCTFAPVNATNLHCSIGAVQMQKTGPVRVVSTRADGTMFTRREGAVGSGADFSMSGTGVLTFYAGVAPSPGETLMVHYRRSGRALARVQSADALAEQQALALPALPVWSGHAALGAARSSADCIAAAEALLRFAGDASAMTTGHCTLTNAQQVADITPGDVLALADESGTRRLPVWSVTLTDSNCSPEVMRYRVEFAQTEGQCLSFKTDATLSADVPLPVALSPAAGSQLASLAGLQVLSASVSALQVDAGVDPPSGGGFEVRGTDGAFAPGPDAGLVLRSPVRGFAIPRATFRERFFVRMYDGSTPPRYSQWSSAVLTHLPVA